MNYYSSFFRWVCLAMLPLLFSCADLNKATYFNGLQDSVIQRQAQSLDAAIEKADILSISVTSLNPEASAIFNMPNLPAGIAATGTNSTLGNSAGYLVNSDGMIQFPILGQIKAAGTSKKQLAEYISKIISEKKLLRDPIVSVRQLNFHVTVLGEVARPTVITVPNEKINLLEAIGFAGDLTLYANRDNVLLIREQNGEQITRRINLNSSSALSSPYYMLQSGDIIYAEPNKAKLKSTGQGRQMLPLIMSGLSVTIIALDRLFR